MTIPTASPERRDLDDAGCPRPTATLDAGSADRIAGFTRKVWIVPKEATFQRPCSNSTAIDTILPGGLTVNDRATLLDLLQSVRSNVDGRAGC